MGRGGPALGANEAVIAQQMRWAGTRMSDVTSPPGDVAPDMDSISGPSRGVPYRQAPNYEARRRITTGYDASQRADGCIGHQRREPVEFALRDRLHTRCGGWRERMGAQGKHVWV
jgi:hypothetical protein